MSGHQASVAEQLNSAIALQVQLNRQKLASIIKTTLFCGHQNISLRGHRESSVNTNPGNFRSLLAFQVDSGDELQKEHISLAPRNAVYTSNTIQNNLISLIGK